MSENASKRARRTAAGLAALLVAALLPLLAPAAPALAADDACLSEQAGLLQPKCDDTVPPTTVIVAKRPQPVHGWIRNTAIQIEFHGEHADDPTDADPIGYQCQFFTSASAPSTWTTCTSPVTYTDLEQNGATPYTFRVRAVDSADDGIDATSGLLGAETDLPDYDQTPAELVFRADATTPNTFGFLRSTFYDQERQDEPMVAAPAVQIKLQSNEGDTEQRARYRCRLNDRAVACVDGLTTLHGLKAGLQRFSAAAVDPAGNVDPTPFMQRFFVPRNLTTRDAVKSSKGDWRRVRGAGSFAGDYLESRTYGATLSFRARNVREIRLLAPSASGLGKVQVRVGHGAWTTVNLASGTAGRLHVYTVRDRFTGRMSGPIQLRVASRGKPVRVDAVSAR